jgi:hypothetical protein
MLSFIPSEIMRNYGDVQQPLNYYLPLGAGPRLRGARVMPVRASMSVIHAGEPTGRPTAFRAAKSGVSQRFVELFA